MLEVKRGDLIYVDLMGGVGSEQKGRRPAIVIQNDVGNRFSTTVIVAILTSVLDKPELPTHVEIQKDPLYQDSICMLEQLRTIDKRRIVKVISHTNKELMDKVNRALKISLALE